MIRNLIAIVLGCLYVAGSIWLVHNEGLAYRASLSKARPLASDADRTSHSPTVEKERAVAPVTSPEIAPTRLEPAPPTSAKVAKHTPKHTAHQPSPVASAPELARATPSITDPGRKTAAHPVRSAALNKPLAKDAFWSQPQLAKVWDLTYLKLEGEKRLGAELHELIIQFNPLLEEGPWLGRVEDVAEPLQKSAIRKDIRYKFFILNSDTVNAFATPGGYVYVSRGLLDLVGEDEDYALQFAVGHEMAHVDLQHAIKCLQDPGVMKMSEGTLQKLYMLILPFGYLESEKGDQEFEADDWVSNRMQRLGRTREILVFLQKLDGYAKKNGFENGRIKPKPGRDLSPLENHYRAQTAARKRLKHLKEFTEQAAKSAK